MKQILTVLTMVLVLGGSNAFARECGRDMRSIDAALEQGKGSMLSERDLSDVRELRTSGEMLHKDGKHASSVAVLHRAMEILGLSQGGM